MIKKITVLLLLLFINFKLFAQDGVFIVYKINNQIITNVDINEEAKYLLALNNQLKNLDEKKIYELARESIVKEKIKKIEILKYFDLGQKNTFLDNVIKNFYLRLGLKNETEFSAYLEGYNLTINDVLKKIEIEATWNQLIYQKYKDIIDVDIDSLKKKLSTNRTLADKKSYLLSEILFKNNKEKPSAEIIKESIRKIGFKNTANIYSISDSSKFGGDMGWVVESNLSKKILIELKKIKINEHTKPIQFDNKFLIIKIENIKIEKIEKNEKKELEQMVQFETNKQLENFSKIFFSKVKINIDIDEL
jgi:peptidyl-prolyl cis-trans isomerase SurA|tara:strand:+ start:1932 stop:2849 length:918 start_codon:yes stop_codon:yes gene_type:complete